MEIRTDPTPARPDRELLDRLYLSKQALRAMRTALPLPAKVAAVVQLQRAMHPLIERQRPLRPWERPWNVTP
ncbi:MAG TPA: hypothetical protein VJK49_00960 [Candidatus Limnocylindrales bacterium]|nr:MAG: hypothetical protein A3H95_16240 [Acidobacteria bacterium RIFCSPLOWO2_02_FULL_64_15]OFW33384.1 MAG: hypothetical protein A3G76_00980 [Acidobacteria bacterium RIFCSPLOWO2_12_FULL_65_11]HLB43925.1 hypothetical protein [Candidatus Limnocylindrales bacterium]